MESHSAKMNNIISKHTNDIIFFQKPGLDKFADYVCENEDVDMTTLIKTLKPTYFNNKKNIFDIFYDIISSDMPDIGNYLQRNIHQIISPFISKNNLKPFIIDKEDIIFYPKKILTKIKPFDELYDLINKIMIVYKCIFFNKTYYCKTISKYYKIVKHLNLDSLLKLTACIDNLDWTLSKDINMEKWDSEIREYILNIERCIFKNDSDKFTEDELNCIYNISNSYFELFNIYNEFINNIYNSDNYKKMLTIIENDIITNFEYFINKKAIKIFNDYKIDLWYDYISPKISDLYAIKDMNIYKCIYIINNVYM